MVNMAFLSSVGVTPHHLIVDSLVRASDVTTAQQMQQDFYTDDLRFTEAHTSWALVVQNARAALQG